MKTKHLKRGQLVLVEWLDIYEDPRADSAQDLEAVPMKTVGWFYGVDGVGRSRTLKLVNTRHIVKDGVGGPYGCLAIPLGCVQKLARLKGGRR